jgi:hypothetical protein
MVAAALGPSAQKPQLQKTMTFDLRGPCLSRHGMLGRDLYFVDGALSACANTGDVEGDSAAMCGVETGGWASGEDVSVVSESSQCKVAR